MIKKKDLRETDPELAEDALSDEELEPEKKQKPVWREILDYVIMIGVVVAAVLFINEFLLINARIPSSSMENTIMINDRVFGNRLAYNNADPERYDIIIFKYPDDESKYFIKRIIGLPGETVNIVDGKVYIDGSDTPLDDGFCREQPVGNFGPYTVPDNCYFVMGDNRNNSNDSRYWTNTFVKRDEILGKAFFRYWPLNRMGPVGDEE